MEECYYAVLIMLTVVHAECRRLALYAECHYTECHYAKCRDAPLSAILLSALFISGQYVSLSCPTLTL
jgi:hypothetical protein